LFFGYHPQRFAVGIEVNPDMQRRGIGGMLYDRIMKELADLGAKVATPLVLASDFQSAKGIKFAASRGYVEKRRTIESKLDLERLDLNQLKKATERMAEEGISIADFASETRGDASAGRKLKDLEDSGAQDVPGAIADAPMDFHDYEIITLRSPIIDWKGSFVAKSGDAFVGESSLLKSGIEGTLDQGFTVVRPGFRGKGIAQAVKASVASYAKSRGARLIRTHNDAENAPMLSINRKLGFVKQAEWIAFEKELP
ncbi:MAG TPA: GNAT family N-acetyltransferase, partial [Nitrososphaerales archaeon]|nr:GNAT family N-acetyltransferase [Nitrososphaerales archaeon]